MQIISIKSIELKIFDGKYFQFNKNTHLQYNNDFTRLTNTDFTGRFKELRIPSTK